MSRQVNGIAAVIIQQGAFSALDCGDQDGSNLGSHVGFAFDEWADRYQRLPGAQCMERDEFVYSVRQAVEKLGFKW